MTEYELPNISVDVVPVLLDAATGNFSVVLGKRIYEPFLGEYALPGVLLTPHERLDEAAYRALKTKVLVDEEAVEAIIDLGTFDNPDRDPRGATVSIAKLAILKSGYSYANSDDVETFPIDTLANGNALPFDHNTIVSAAATLISEKLLFSKVLTRALLGEVFSTKTLRSALKQLQSVDTAEDMRTLDLSNLTRQLKGSGWFSTVEPTVETISLSSTTTSRGRPANNWTWLG